MSDDMVEMIGKSPAPAAKRQCLSVDLGSLKDSWLAWCKAQGTSSSDAMREVVRRLTTGEVAQPGMAPVARALRGERDSKRVRREIALTGSEDALARSVAEGMGFSVPKWLIACVRAQLTGQPQFGHQELNALTESNYQLLAIGRNLNQIARAINRNPDVATPLQAEAIEELRAVIDHHVGQVARVVEANTERWRLL